LDSFDFAEVIRRARAGDDTATAKLLSQFEPEVRTMVRIRLPRALRNQFDSMDFVQAVWKSDRIRRRRAISRLFGGGRSQQGL